MISATKTTFEAPISSPQTDLKAEVSTLLNIIDTLQAQHNCLSSEQKKTIDMLKSRVNSLNIENEQLKSKLLTETKLKEELEKQQETVRRQELATAEAQRKANEILRQQLEAEKNRQRAKYQDQASAYYASYQTLKYVCEGLSTNPVNVYFHSLGNNHAHLPIMNSIHNTRIDHLGRLEHYWEIKNYTPGLDQLRKSFNQEMEKYHKLYLEADRLKNSI